MKIQSIGSMNFYNKASSVTMDKRKNSQETKDSVDISKIKKISVSNALVVNQIDNTQLTDEEKWNAIVSKYKQKGITIDNYGDMLCDLTNAGLMTKDEMDGAMGNALAKWASNYSYKDMKDGILGNYKLSYGDNLINFNFLLEDVNDDSKDYLGFDKYNDQRSYLKDFYNKII